MPNELPTRWASQLAAIILLFSVATSLFPLGMLFMVYPPNLPTRIMQYNGWFEANLTIGTPNATVDLGYSNTILISYESVEATEPPVALSIQNSANATVFYIPEFGGTAANATHGIGLSLPLTNYTLLIQRLTNDTLFHCHIDAYEYRPPPDIWRVHLTTFGTLGIILYIVAGYLLLNFYKRTKHAKK